MDTNSHLDALRSRWTLEGRIPLSGVAEGASWHRARTVASGEDVALLVVHGPAALEAADAVRRAYLVEDPHLVPVREIVVLEDPREESATDGTAGEPTTVVEYPLPTSPPLAALLADGPLHPETARAVIGEAATGLEVARRRGLRHQLLDSNRVFVDTASGAVSVLGVGVEAAAHTDLDRSREIASFQDTRALVALLFRALTGRSPRPGADGTIPRPSALRAEGAPPIPEDLDLLCELVLGGAAEEGPETTRDLIEALEPWQSIPVTLEAYAGRGATPAASARDAAPAAPVVVPGRETSVSAGSAAPTSGEEAPTSDPTPQRQADAAPATESFEPLTADRDLPEEDTVSRTPGAAASGTAGAAAAAAAAGVVGAGAASAAVDPENPEAPESSVPAEEQETTAAPSSSAAEGEAKALVKELHLDERRSSSAFPGHLDVAAPAPRPAATDTGTDAAAATGSAAHTDAATAHDAAPLAAGAGAAGAATVGAAAAVAAAAPSGPSSPADPSDPSAPTSPSTPVSPSTPADAPGTSAPESAESGVAPAAAEPGTAALPAAAGTTASTALTPATHHRHDSASSAAEGTGPLAVSGRTESLAPVDSGPIVVRGRDRSALESDVPEDTVPASRSSLLREVVGVAVDADDPQTWGLGPAQPAARSRQAQWILLGAVLLVIIAMVFAITSITSGLRQRVENPLNTQPVATATTAAPSEEASPTAEEESPSPTATLPAPEVTGVEEFNSSTLDHPEQASRITDGDTGTFWSTKLYTSSDFGGLKDGTGIKLTFAEESTITKVTVTTARNTGGTIELHAVNADGSLRDVAATAQFNGDGEAVLTPKEPLEADGAALWIPDLPQDSVETDRYRGRIAEVRVE